LSKLVSDTLSDDTDSDDDDGNDSDSIPSIDIPNVKAHVLQKVIDYCTHYHQVEAMTPIQTPLPSNILREVVQTFYADFCMVDKVLLFELVTAANFMDIKPLLDLTCFAVAALIRGKTASEIREIFNIPKEFTAEEEEQVRLENAWCDVPHTRSDNAMHNDRDNDNES